ncbi:unnamed protein product [Cylicocyclus nassatus]|uniref:protein-disulfide reductase n=1 Tax=Cylicocyclus nassatus TaxID=53992 RepID=A0AA36H670_CYLNA|nr:unnamed protein product [Cylicocyclus nassatus]
MNQRYLLSNYQQIFLGKSPPALITCLTPEIVRSIARADRLRGKIYHSNMAELLSGVKIQLKDGSQVDAGEYLKGKMVGLYFSASWCPPCRAFTPKLKRFYEAIKETHPDFEIVLVSRDKEADELFEYYDEHMGDWTFIPFGDPKIEELLEKYQARTIPGMRVIRPDGSVVVKDARQEIQEKAAEDPEALFEEWEAFYL